MRALLPGIVTALWATACSSPCGDLKAHARSCEFAPGRYIDERDSVCRQIRSDLRAATAADTFDAFSQCVVDSPCDDTTAVQTCSETHFAAQLADPCTKYRLWAAACGLDPIGTQNGCQDDNPEGTVPFAEWVECITADGCPKPKDPRYQNCHNLVPPETLVVLDACLLVTDWAKGCPDAANSGAILVTDSLTTCLFQAQPFVPESVNAWAQCQAQKECDDTLGSAACLGELRLLNQVKNRSQCTELVEYATVECNTPSVGGGTVDACQVVFARATADSLEEYIACLKAFGCGQILVAALTCSEVLEFE